MSSANKITIISGCDNHYAVMLAALIKSIEINYKAPEKIDFYIVDDNIRQGNKQKLIDTANPDRITLHWLKMSDVLLLRDLKLPLDHSSFPLNIYMRLFIPYFMPANIEKVLYLDVDMILLENISKLWETNMNGKIIAAAVDRAETVSNPWGGILNYKELGLAPESKYFNSGLLLMDLIKWKNSDITTRVINCIKENMEYANFPDQYGLNLALADQWTELDPRWNCPSTSSQKAPYLIHFIGRKPIYKTYDHNSDYKDQFYKYLKLTEWRNYKPAGEYIRLLKKLYNKVDKFLLKYR